MGIPNEFNPEAIAAKSAPDMRMYQVEVSSTEPMKSLLESNPEIYFVTPKGGSQWGTWEFKPGSYYDTTTGVKHPYWAEHRLPQPTQDRCLAKFARACHALDKIELPNTRVIGSRHIEQRMLVSGAR